MPRIVVSSYWGGHAPGDVIDVESADEARQIVLEGLGVVEAKGSSSGRKAEEAK
jgi:hypothetical protein